MAAGLCLLLWGCKGDDNYVAPTVKNTIGFVSSVSDTASTRTTTGLLNSNYDFAQTGNSFGVYGYKYDATLNEQIFTDEPVTCTRNGSNVAWDYEPLRYWDIQRNYTFIAYAPYNSATPAVVSGMSPASTSGTTGDISLGLSGVPGWQPALSGYDIVVSQAVNRAPGENDVVYLRFNHILSRVMVRYRLAGALPSGCTITIDTTSISYMPQSGDYLRSYTQATATHTDTWSHVTLSNDYHLMCSSDSLLATTYKQYGSQYLVIPWDYTTQGTYPKLHYHYKFRKGVQGINVGGTIDLKSGLPAMKAGTGVAINIIISYNDGELHDYDQLNPDAFSTWWTAVGY